MNFLQPQKDANPSFPSTNPPSPSSRILPFKPTFLLVFLQDCPQPPPRTSVCPKCQHQESLLVLKMPLPSKLWSPRKQVDWGALRNFSLLYSLSSDLASGDADHGAGCWWHLSQGAQVTTIPSHPRDPIPPSVSMSTINPQEDPLRIAAL